MSTAKKKYNDEPPLDKKTIKKGHEIGDKLSKMKNEDHPAKQMFEQIEGLKNKAEKSGMPYKITNNSTKKCFCMYIGVCCRDFVPFCTLL